MKTVEDIIEHIKFIRGLQVVLDTEWCSLDALLEWIESDG